MIGGEIPILGQQKQEQEEKPINLATVLMVAEKGINQILEEYPNNIEPLMALVKIRECKMHLDYFFTDLFDKGELEEDRDSPSSLEPVEFGE